jgi:hypothetical protein
MLLVRHLALPLAVGCGAGAIRIEERVAAAQRAIANDHDPLVAAFDVVKHLHGDVVEAVSEHGASPAGPVPVQDNRCRPVRSNHGREARTFLISIIRQTCLGPRDGMRMLESSPHHQ